MKERIRAALLMLLLLVFGCGAGKADPEALHITTADQSSARDAMNLAWRSDEVDREFFTAEGEGDLVALRDNTLFIIRKKQLGIYHVENGGLYRLCTLDVGFWWGENREENSWSGCEKTPLELFVSDDRLAVLSAWAEYSENWTGEERVFSDLSRTALDIFDISDPANPVPVASYGQDGSVCAGYVDDEGHLWLLSRRSIYEADYAMPSVHNSEHRMELETDHVDLHEGGRAQMIVLGLYDLTDGVRRDARGLLGGGERAVLGADGAYIIGGSDAVVIHYPFDTESIKAPQATKLGGSALDAQLLDGVLYIATQTEEHTRLTALSTGLSPLWERELSANGESWGFGADCFQILDEGGLQVLNLSDRSLRQGKLNAARVERLDEQHWLALDYSADGSALDLSLLRAGAKGTLKESGGRILGYTYRPALEEERGYWQSGTLLALCSETGCSLFAWDESTFTHLQDVYTADNSAHMRFFVLGDYLYIADTREVHALRLQDLVFVGEWFL